MSAVKCRDAVAFRPLMGGMQVEWGQDERHKAPDFCVLEAGWVGEVIEADTGNGWIRVLPYGAPPQLSFMARVALFDPVTA